MEKINVSKTTARNLVSAVLASLEETGLTRRDLKTKREALDTVALDVYNEMRRTRRRERRAAGEPVNNW